MAWDRRIVSKYRLHEGGCQFDGARYSRAYQKMLDRLFARPDLPERVRVQEPSVRAFYSLFTACRCYATGQIDDAVRDLERAVVLDPGLANGQSSMQVAQMIAATADSWWVADPLAYVNQVFSNLPPALPQLAALRSEALSVMHMKRVFHAHATGQEIRPSDWLRGVYYAPRWLLNRGVWSIGVQRLVGRRVTAWLRKLVR